MKHNIFLLKIHCFIMLYIFAFMGCVSNKDALYQDIKLSANSVPDGIRLIFTDIPPETTRIFISVQLESSNPVDGSHTFADIRNTALDQIKKSRTLICPFVQSGREYFIVAFFSMKGERDPEKIDSVTATAGGGVHTTNVLSLNLNKNNTGVTLSDIPDFSAVVSYASQKYIYQTTVRVDKNMSLGYGEMIDNALTWIFYPAMKEDFIKDGIEASGDLSAFVTVYCNLIYENIPWMVGIAQSEEFTVSL